ncbi:hypothetical protein [Pseudoalteromonas luteoviolacea]|uniref:Uncharacterized protein n=1 Tax=Pseudoalteromonas luteoviolacea H33 TaxID=1365251 RepID=A0A167DP13_9GAMM|nr:hypothetical protein [Pseudoalteromonas luteoviolacea]KZN49144.1 hypothetical protein N476_20105 [Pseudoalteromonas luteoviolacea H33]KZN73574.1 hypothetical protein N477_23005 [Pseudoalteromonas luteoviolacea H33-S]MBQ4875582.1 hypothetical protein [Pseudoalteromonas luteoviolacea]MBQ4904617.1 hypothetical protein [Pseudoalteromonas luteoviolacea]
MGDEAKQLPLHVYKKKVFWGVTVMPFIGGLSIIFGIAGLLSGVNILGYLIVFGVIYSLNYTAYVNHKPVKLFPTFAELKLVPLGVRETIQYSDIEVVKIEHKHIEIAYKKKNEPKIASIPLELFENSCQKHMVGHFQGLSTKAKV